MELATAMKCCLLIIVSCALLNTPVAARPSHRQKRVSDQRLAELETLLAIAKMKNRKFVPVPVGYGLIDVHQIGRRKRSEPLEIGHQDLLSSSDYYQSDLQPGFSSADSDSVKDERLFGGNYSDDEESSEAEESNKDRTGYMLAGLRPGSRGGFFLGMRGQQHPRFI